MSKLSFGRRSNLGGFILNEDIEEIAGVYKITNIDTKEAYVGESFNLAKRQQQHKTDLECGTHHNMRLQYDYSHGGSFKFEVIKAVEVPYSIRGKAYLLKWEDIYIGDKRDKYNCIYTYKDSLDIKKVKPIFNGCSTKDSYNACWMVEIYGEQAFYKDYKDFYYGEIVNSFRYYINHAAKRGKMLSVNHLYIIKNVKEYNELKEEDAVKVLLEEGFHKSGNIYYK